MAKISLVGSKFTKIFATKNPDFSGKLSMKTNIKVTSIEAIKEAKEAIKISYEFQIEYPKLGEIELRGNLFITTDQKTIKSLQKSWKDKKFENEEYMMITNLINQKATLKALELEEEIGLPIHIKLPTLNYKKD
tara:strand:+ start:11144 stop:11545 length:402 start_codon:yes stop_codon:yes gene_type:complete